MKVIQFIRTVADILPWLVLGLLVYAFWPLFSLLARMAGMFRWLLG